MTKPISGDQLFPFVIPAGGGASEAIKVPGYGLIEIKTPAAWTSSAAIVPELSHDNVSFSPLYDSLGNAVTVAADANRMIRLDVALFWGARYLRFKAGNQASARACSVRGVPLNGGALNLF